MIRRLLLLLVASSFCLTLSAQVTLTLSPQVVELDVDESQFETVAHSWLVNTSDETKTFRWIRHVESATEGWASAICDFNACYNVTVDSSITDVVLGPGDSTNLDVHIRPMGIDGQAHVRLRAFEIENPENFIEGNYHFNQTLSLDREDKVALKLFPNPAHDYFQLSQYDNVALVVIYSMAGRKIRTYPVYQDEKFDISNLHRGLYFVRLVNRKQKVIQALRLNKR